MQVADLIAALSHLDPHAEVRMAYPSGDYWRNTLAGDVDAAELRTLVWSDYHQAWKLPGEEATVEPADSQLRAVVLEGR